MSVPPSKRRCLDLRSRDDEYKLINEQRPPLPRKRPKEIEWETLQEIQKQQIEKERYIQNQLKDLQLQKDAIEQTRAKLYKLQQRHLMEDVGRRDQILLEAREVANDRKKLEVEKRIVDEDKLRLGAWRRTLANRARDGHNDNEARIGPIVFRDCIVYKAAIDAFKKLQIPSDLLDRRFDRCYCPNCYGLTLPNVIQRKSNTPYVIPRGWVRIGLSLPPWVKHQNMFEDWSVSFHGTKAEALKQIIEFGLYINMPGDKLYDGTTLASTNCAGRTDSCIYTSPTIRYAGLQFYAKPYTIDSCSSGQFVFQCRQYRSSFTKRGETMNFRKKWDQHIICPHTPTESIEWITTRRQTVVPTGVMIRTYRTTSTPDAFHSPVDPNPVPNTPLITLYRQPFNHAHAEDV